jgi:hypothetical protein
MFDNLTAAILEPLALILSSPFFLLSASKQRKMRRSFQLHGISSEGVVVRFDEQKGYDDTTVYVPVISFVLRGQKWVTLPYNGSTLFSSFKTGQIVSVLYKLENHTDFIVLDDEKPWIELSFGVVGLGLLVTGLAWLAYLI